MKDSQPPPLTFLVARASACGGRSSQGLESTGGTGCGKVIYFVKRSEESLIDLNPRKERFLGAQHASEWQKFEFFRKL
jgi:hypothetical protein